MNLLILRAESLEPIRKTSSMLFFFFNARKETLSKLLFPFFKINPFFSPTVICQYIKHWFQQSYFWFTWLWKHSHKPIAYVKISAVSPHVAESAYTQPRTAEEFKALLCCKGKTCLASLAKDYYSYCHSALRARPYVLVAVHISRQNILWIFTAWTDNSRTRGRKLRQKLPAGLPQGLWEHLWQA